MLADAAKPPPTPDEPSAGLKQPPDIPEPPAVPQAEPLEHQETADAPGQPPGSLRQPPDIPAAPPEPAVTPAPPPAGEPIEVQPFPTEPTGDQINLVHADEVYYEAGVIVYKGNVVVRMEDMTIYADVVEIDEEGEQVMVHGNLRVETPNQDSQGEKLLINLETECWELHMGRSRIEPDFFGPEQVYEPLYVEGRQVKADPDRNLVELFNGQLTSCELEHAHYALRSHHAELRPGNKVVIEKPTLYLLGMRLFRYPFNVVMSLEEDRNRIVPELGVNEVEGGYAKFAYLYLAGYAGWGIAKAHVTEERGTGWGLEHYLDTDGHRAEGSLFFEPDVGSLTGRIHHEYLLSDNLRSDIRGSYQHNSGYFGTSTSDWLDWRLYRNTAKTQSELGLRRSVTASGWSTSRQYNMSLNHQQRPGQRTRWSLYTNARRRSRSTSTDSQEPDDEMDARFAYYRNLGWFDWQLLADNRYDLDGSAYTGDGYYALNRLPEITISTESRRLGDYKLLGRVPFRTSLELGRYVQDPEGMTVGRTALDIDLGGGERRLGRRTRLDVRGRYLQAFYDEGSALYTTRFNTTLRQDWGGHWASQVRYGHQARKGFAPIRLDYGGRRHDVYWETVRLMPNHSRIFLSTGYDFIRDRWRDALLRTEYMPSASSKLELQSGYSLDQARWRPLSLRWRQVKPDRLYLALGSEYDLRRSEMTRATMELDWAWHRFWRVELLAGYSGYRNELTTLDVELTRDLHCLIASVAYSKQLNEFRLNLGIKAFPAPERLLGIGRTGARFESLPGQYF